MKFCINENHLYLIFFFFGRLCFVTNFTERDKFVPRALLSVFWGYSTTQKGYRVMRLDTRSKIFSRDVIFSEQEFPLARKTPISHAIWPKEDSVFATDDVDMHGLSDHGVTSRQVDSSYQNSPGSNGQMVLDQLIL